MTTEIPTKLKYRPTKVWYGFPRKHSGNSNPKPKKTLPGPSIKTENHTVLVMDGRTGKARMRRKRENQVLPDQ